MEIETAEELIVQEEDDENTFFYGSLDIPIYM